MDNWKDPRRNPRKSRVTTDILLVILMLLASCVCGWSLAHLVHALVN